MISKSPQRGTFQKNAHIERKSQDGELLNDEYLVLFESTAERKAKQEQDPEWQKNNLEYDLRTTEWILEKVRASEPYAQNLYAAMCNRSFVRNDVWPILKQEGWRCSWRYAGGILADMRQQGDYIDWYCSGIRGSLTDEEYLQLSKEQQEDYHAMKQFVSEGIVTDEIREDLLRLGWLVSDDEN
jgi:hypothetical protein